MADVELQDPTIIDLADGEGEDSKDYSVSVNWIKTYERQDAKTFPGIFAFPGAVCRLSDKNTLFFLSAQFGSPSEMTREAFEPHIWIEKTIVAGRPDRQDGEYALGKVLWSPQRSKDRADIYRFMRDISPGDIVLHLTDNQGFTAVSEAKSVAESFGGVPGTEWGSEPSYRVTLNNFTRLDPPLNREVFFASPFRERLLDLITSGQKNLFYNSGPALNQGAYLTPAPPALLRILDDAYRSVAGKALIAENGVLESARAKDASQDVVSFDRLVKRTFWTEAKLSSIIESIRHPVRPSRQIILAGPPGTSKTFVAQELIWYLTKGDASKSHLVQFHPSYSYEQFIEGLRPTIVDGAVKFQPVPGIVLELAERCRHSPEDHFLIIDELNRANLSRVLGELMYLFEYRNKAIDLPYTRNFALPSNLYFIGTMNTADRNIRSIDIALRRRFDVFDCPADADVLRRFYTEADNLCDVSDLVDGFVRLNDKLIEDLDEHHTVGHAFFMASHFTDDDLEAVWHRKIRPLLSEYFFASPDVAKSYVAEKFWPSLSE